MDSRLLGRSPICSFYTGATEFLERVKNGGIATHGRRDGNIKEKCIADIRMDLNSDGVNDTSSLSQETYNRHAFNGYYLVGES